MSHRNVRKILILRFSSLGDIVMATAMIRALRETFPAGQIDMVVREDFLDLIRNNPHLDTKIGLPRKNGLSGLLRLRRHINRQGYDLIYDAHRSLRTLLLMPFLKARHKAYFVKHYLRRDLALTFKLPLLRGWPRLLERYLEPLKAFGVRYDRKGPEIFVDEATQRKTREKVAFASSESSPVIGVIPSAQWPGKRWPLPYFRKLIEKLVEQTSHRIVVFGGREDGFCHELCRGFAATRVLNAQGRLSILESAAFLKTCSLVVANDTGLMHVADALNVPSVLILGPTSRELGCLPFHPLSRILEHPLWCRPCSKNGQAPCIRRRRYCLTRTSPEMVFAATMQVISSLSKRS